MSVGFLCRDATMAMCLGPTRIGSFQRSEALLYLEVQGSCNQTVTVDINYIPLISPLCRVGQVILGV